MNSETLIHELTHVWQYQHDGAIYFPEAGWDQFVAWLNNEDAYDYGDVTGLQKKIADGEGFDSFNREQQGRIVEDYFKIRTDGVPENNAHLPWYAHFVDEVSSFSEAELLTIPVPNSQ